MEERSNPCCPLASEGAASNQGDHGAPSRCSSSQPDLWKIFKCHGVGEGVFKNGSRAPQWQLVSRVERRKRGGGFKLWTRRTGRSFGPRSKSKEVLSVRHVTDDWFHFFEFCNQGHSGLKRHFKFRMSRNSSRISTWLCHYKMVPNNTLAPTGSQHNVQCYESLKYMRKTSQLYSCWVELNLLAQPRETTLVKVSLPNLLFNTN